MDDELEPVPAGSPLAGMTAEIGNNADDRAYARFLELGGGVVLSDREASEWHMFLMSLDDADSGTVDAEDSLEVDGIGWIEDTHGGAVFVPYC